MKKRPPRDPKSLARLSGDALLLPLLLRRKLARPERAGEGLSLSATQLSVLLLLQRHRQLTVSELSRRLDMAGPNVTPLVDRLVEAGYLDRQHDTRDRRVVNLTLLPAGEEALSTVLEDMAARLEVRAGALSPLKFRELCTALDRVARILEEL